MERERPYYPSGLVVAARAQYPDQPRLAEALSECTSVIRESEFYIYFLDASSDPDLKHLACPIRESVTLDDTPEGDVVVDILHNDRVAGIELYEKLMENP